MKLIGHKLVLDIALDGQQTIGFHTEYALSHFVDSLTSFLKHEESSILKPVLKALQSAENYFKTFLETSSATKWETLLNDWNNHELILLPIGFKDHVTVLILLKTPEMKKYAAYINVGASIKESGAYLFEMQTELSKSHLNLIRNYYDIDSTVALPFFETNQSASMQGQLKLKQIYFMAHPQQVVGNCTVASLYPTIQLAAILSNEEFIELERPNFYDGTSGFEKLETHVIPEAKKEVARFYWKDVQRSYDTLLNSQEWGKSASLNKAMHFRILSATLFKILDRLRSDEDKGLPLHFEEEKRSLIEKTLNHLAFFDYPIETCLGDHRPQDSDQFMERFAEGAFYLRPSSISANYSLSVSRSNGAVDRFLLRKQDGFQYATYASFILTDTMGRRIGSMTQLNDLKNLLKKEFDIELTCPVYPDVKVEKLSFISKPYSYSQVPAATKRPSYVTLNAMTPPSFYEDSQIVTPILIRRSDFLNRSRV